MLAIYTFMFSMAFKVRWAGGTDSKTEFALVLFACLMVFNLFSKSVNRDPGLILGNVNCVKKVVFPLEILPVVAQDSAAFHLAHFLFAGGYRQFMQISPLTPVVEQTHDVMISGKDLDWCASAVYLLLLSIIAWLGFMWFQMTRKGVADVL